MTEERWLRATDAAELLKFLARGTSLRKLQLFLYNYARICEHFVASIQDQRNLRAALELGEKWADDLIEHAEVFTSDIISREVIILFPNEGELRNRASWGVILDRRPPLPARGRSAKFLEARRSNEQDKRDELQLLRDIFGNPFRPVAFDAAWRTDTAVSLARGMYESRDFGAMPILADALQDAGCDSDDVLDHCRGPEPHVRGCWVVDLVLGKS